MVDGVWLVQIVSHVLLKPDHFSSQHTAGHPVVGPSCAGFGSSSMAPIRLAFRTPESTPARVASLQATHPSC